MLSGLTNQRDCFKHFNNMLKLKIDKPNLISMIPGSNQGVKITVHHNYNPDNPLTTIYFTLNVLNQN